MTSALHAPDHAHALKCELAGEVLRSCGKVRLQVTGWSMLPAVWPGDILFVERTSASAVSEGDVVLFGREQRLCAHRIVEKLGGSTFLARGDANPQPDPPVHSQELLGKVCSIVRNGKCTGLRRRRSIPQRVIAALVRNSRIAARILVQVSRSHHS